MNFYCDYTWIDIGFMAPKKGISAGTSQSYDQSKFVSFIAQTRFTNRLKLHVIQERGLTTTSDKIVKRTIEDNKWNLLCEHPGPVVVPIVREFYANGMDRDGYKAFVQGKWVPFDRTSINNYYGLDNVDDEEYQAILDSDNTNWDAIREELCKVQVA